MLYFFITFQAFGSSCKHLIHKGNPSCSTLDPRPSSVRMCCSLLDGNLNCFLTVSNRSMCLYGLGGVISAFSSSLLMNGRSWRRPLYVSTASASSRSAFSHSRNSGLECLHHMISFSFNHLALQQSILPLSNN